MVWGGISLEAKTDLVFIDGGANPINRRGLTAIRYTQEVLENHVMPYAGFIGENMLFMHDNAKPHSAKIVKCYLQEVGIQTMEWPARSPDLNPIEHL